jgi:hypothetical protein
MSLAMSLTEEGSVTSRSTIDRRVGSASASNRSEALVATNVSYG